MSKSMMASNFPTTFRGRPRGSPLQRRRPGYGLDLQDFEGDREGRPYKDYEPDTASIRIFVRATLAVALFPAASFAAVDSSNVASWALASPHRAFSAMASASSRARRSALALFRLSWYSSSGM